MATQYERRLEQLVTKIARLNGELAQARSEKKTVLAELKTQKTISTPKAAKKPAKPAPKPKPKGK